MHDVLLEMVLGPKADTTPVNWEIRTALESIKELFAVHVKKGPTRIHFALHKKAGEVKRFYLIGISSWRSLGKTVASLRKFKFEVIIFADLLNLSGGTDKYEFLKKLEDRYGTRRMFSGDLVAVTLAMDKARNERHSSKMRD